MNPNAMTLEPGAEVDWIDFEKALYDRFGVNAVTLQKSGDRKTAGAIRWANRLCEIIQGRGSGSARICRPSMIRLMHEAEVKRRTVAEECPAGIYKMMMPIVSGDRVEGFVSTCGRPFPTIDRIYTAYIHETVDVDEETVKDLLPLLAPIDYRGIKRLRQFVADYPRRTLH
jgi:hypothetical protein